MDDDIARQLAIRDRLRRRMEAQRTPEERLAAMNKLQRACWERLQQNPEGLARFMRRNIRKRAIDVRPEWLDA
ncbi:hypothetical protein [Humisphaera borealis]|uniref:Uncharacterized protein n=1 Tax=Humisphaera borealis TaxID=2807512 RepID=A0A7M2X2R8_9BACT|nr:hypothetical protein [Humisphaera borealis]QOV92067.1 hypothetical protein IPV69_12220 [Humisphaera borealis]